jgi:UDP-2,3-diacylglucosamine hydrolase
LTLLEDPHTATLGGIPTLLTHGDRYCTSDGRYVKFRAQVRDPQWQKELLAQPIEDRRALALKLRKESEANQNMQVAAGEELSDVVQGDITAELMTVNVLRLIHGHTHRPDNHEIHLPDGRNVERIVLADWRTNGEALLVKDDGTAERQVLTP